jgi:hypothetical protein
MFVLSTGLCLAGDRALATPPVADSSSSDGFRQPFVENEYNSGAAPSPLIVQCNGVGSACDVQSSVIVDTPINNLPSNITLTAASDPTTGMPVYGGPLPPVQACGQCGPHWFDTLELFGGLEGSKQPQDFGTNAEFGGRIHANWGIPLLPEYGLGLQVGTAVDLTDNAVQVFDRIEGNRDRTQSFTTVGLFQRTDWGLNWAVVYDFLFEDYYDNFDLGQFRAKVGFALSCTDEIGARGTIATESDHGTFGAIPLTLRPISQASAFWRHTWENCSQTTVWIGGCPGHGEVNVALGDLHPTGPCVVFGADLHIPLSDSWAIFGEANFLTPADTGTVDAYLGFAYYFGGTAHGFRQRQYSPVLPVADSTSFAVDLSRR